MYYKKIKLNKIIKIIIKLNLMNENFFILDFNISIEDKIQTKY